MKKYLIVLAAAAIALASCNGGGNKYTSISFKESQRTLVIGEQVKFSVMWEPTSIEEAPLCTWASSDTTVLKVDENGNVAAVGLGTANITATYEELAAVCHVTVERYEAMWAPSTTIYYFPGTKSEQPINDSLYQFEYPSGIYECKMHTVEILIPNTIEFDGGIGEGDCVLATISALFITKTPEGKEQFQGQIWDVGMEIVADSATFKEKEMSTFAGFIDPAVTGAAWQALFEQFADEEAEEDPDYERFSEDYKKGVSGAHIASAELTSTGASWYPFYDGIIKSGYIKTVYDENAEEYLPDYKFEAQWCYGYVGGFYTGLQLNQEATSYAEVLIQPFELNLSNVWYYENGAMGVERGASAVNARKAPHANLQGRTRKISRNGMVKLEISEARAIAEGLKK